MQMFRQLALALPLVTLGNAGLADCFPDGLSIEMGDNLRFTNSQVYAAARVTNISDFSIGGLIIRVSLLAEGRPRPLASIRFDERDIAGGLMPGETRELVGFDGISPEAIELATESTQLKFEVEIVRAADENLVPFDSSAKVNGWADGVSSSTCD